ncbi:DNA repair protein rad16 [Pseudohyphozyma bogoriensis]|nr:DNA repair protein rad16 [Pseudohyphozyma bogoriensis]
MAPSRRSSVASSRRTSTSAPPKPIIIDSETEDEGITPPEMGTTSGAVTPSTAKTSVVGGDKEEVDGDETESEEEVVRPGSSAVSASKKLVVKKYISDDDDEEEAVATEDDDDVKIVGEPKGKGKAKAKVAKSKGKGKEKAIVLSSDSDSDATVDEWEDESIVDAMELDEDDDDVKPKAKGKGKGKASSKANGTKDKGFAVVIPPHPASSASRRSSSTATPKPQLSSSSKAKGKGKEKAFIVSDSHESTSESEFEPDALTGDSDVDEESDIEMMINEFEGSDLEEGSDEETFEEKKERLKKIGKKEKGHRIPPRKGVELTKKDRSEMKKLSKAEKTNFVLKKNHPELVNCWEEMAKLPKITPERAAQPVGLTQKLLPFQLEGLNWMLKQEKGPWGGGMLADEMGMGKTIQTISLILSDYDKDNRKPTLVLAPTVAILQWRNEIEKFTKGFKVLVFHGQNRSDNAKELESHDVVLTSYAVLESGYRREQKGFKKKGKDMKEDSLLHLVKWNRVILDEAHNIKDRASNTAKAAFALRAKYRWCLSGTPLQNRVGELYSLIRFLGAAPFSYYFCKACDCKSLHWLCNKGPCSECRHSGMQHVCYWNDQVLKPIQYNGHTGPGEEAFKKLTLLLERMMLRRTKVERADDLGLPPRVVNVRRDYFTEEEEEMYQSLFKDVKRKFNIYADEGTVLNNYSNIFTLITRMRQSADHPSLVTHSKTAMPVIHAPGDKVEEILVCRICLDEAEDAVKTACHHIFCRECVRQYLETAIEQRPVCPVCHVHMTIDLDQEAIEQDSTGRQGFLARIDPSKDRTSTKIEALVEELSKLRTEDHTLKSLVFSQFTSMLDLVARRLQLGGFKVVRLQGSMTPTARDATIKHFTNNPDVTVFLISLKAGGVALNLTEASRVFILAMDRIHRLGQHRPVVVTRLIIENSIESRILELQKKKENLAASALGDDDKAMGRTTAVCALSLVQDAVCVAGRWEWRLSSTTSTPPEEVQYSPKDEALANSASVSLVHVRLAEEGRIGMSAIDTTCIYDGVSRGPETIRSSGPKGAVDDVITLTCLLAGVKFSAHPIILGPTSPTLPPQIELITTTSSTSQDLVSYGLRRYQGINDVNSQIWSGLEQSILPTNLASSENGTIRPEYVAKVVSSIYLASKACEAKDLKTKLRVRRLYAWGVTQAVKILDAPLESVKGVDLALLQACVYYIALRETCEAITLGIPSVVSDYNYMRCTECLHYQSLPLPLSADLDYFYLPTPLTATEFRHFMIPILNPVTKTIASLLRDISSKLHGPQLCSAVERWWETIDRLFEWFDGFTWMILADERNCEGSQRRVATILRSLTTTEQCVVELALFVHLGLMRAMDRGERGEEMVGLLKASNARIRSLMARGARRLGLMMSDEATALEVFQPLTFFMRSMSVMGDAILSCVAQLTSTEMQWVSQALKFAAFWDSGAGALDAAMQAMTLEDRSPSPPVLEVPPEARAAAMVHQALQEMV